MPGQDKQSRQAGQKKLNIVCLLQSHWKTLLVGLAAVGAQSAAGLLDPWPLKIILDEVLQTKKTPGWLSHLVLITVGQNPLGVVHFAVAAVLVIALIGAIGSYVEKNATTLVGQRVMHDLRSKLYWHIQRLSMSYHDHKRTGDLISTLTTDIDAVQSALTSGVLDTLHDLLLLVGMMAIMFYLDWRFTLIALSVVPVLFIVVYTFTRKIRQASRALRKKEGEIVSRAQEVLTSIRIIKAFAREEHEQKRFETDSLESVELALRARNIKSKLAPAAEMIVACGTALVLWFGAHQVLEGTLTPGVLVVFFLYLGKMYKPMRELSKIADTYSKAIVGWDRIRDVMAVELHVLDLPGARPAPALQGGIEFDHVTFGYSPGLPVLRDACLKIQPGQVAALVGPTGCGKSTLLSLIPRFYDPQSGAVKLDGVDIREFQRRTIRRQMSFVPQEAVLFRAPLWQNIAYGKPGASRQEIVRAAELANADEFIRRLPDGYDTMVEERGATLSGGERQRIAIARAIIRNTPILILDEPATGLDAASEKMVIEALERLIAGKTAITVAHRLATIRHADVIFVLQDGAILEQGTHAQLLAAGGLYAKFYELQSRKEKEEARAAANPLLSPVVLESA
jgi:subfamily B ATP-binding cassette protein MsbA